jgi:hypothetical protein
MNRFWDWRAQPGNLGVAIAVPEAALEPVELYTASAMILASVAPEGRRLSDILNTNSTLPIRDARSVSVHNGLEGTAGEGWTSVSVDDILLAMPPEHTSARQLRLHRRQHRVRISTGPYHVTGHAHVLPGIALDPYVLRRRMAFLAVTDAEIFSAQAEPWERTARVVLVNVRPAVDLIEVTTIS